MPPRSGLVLFALSLAACGGSEFQGASGTEAGTGGSGAGNVGGATGASGATAGGSGGATGKGGTGGGSGKGGSGTGGGSGKGGSGATGGSGAGAGGAATAGHGGAANGGHGTAGDGTAGNGTVGGSGGSGTAGGGTAGGGTAGGGTGGNATAAGGAAGNGTAGTGAAGAPTCNEGDSTCVTESSYSECVNGATVTKTCSAGFSCDQDATSPALRCRQPLEACADPSAFFCAGQQLQQCISRFAFGFVAQCDSAQLCDLHVGATCAVCAAKGEVTCDGSTLLECEITSQTVLQVCTIGTKCNASAKGCLLTACSAGETRCNAGNIETCDMSLMSWNVTTPCANGCGGTPPACFNCMPATAECTVDGRSVCSADGVGFQPAPCDPATPICVGAGTCVECQATPDCANPEPCVVLAGCNANTCVYVPKDCGPKSMCCDNGSCSDSGHLCE